MTQSVRDMLEQYRNTTSAEFRPLVEDFKKMSLAERDELLFYMVSYMTQQYAGVLRLLHGMGPQPNPNNPMGRPN